MARTAQAPTVKPATRLGDTVETHPAYGQISASRVSGEAYLYGSDFTHHHYMTITIRASELHRGLSQDWPHGREDYVEVALSEAQWATFVSSPNAGLGVQCTVTFLKDRGYLPTLPRPKPRDAQFTEELREHFKDTVENLQKLRERIAAWKGGKDSLALLDKALQDMGVNAEFVAKQFGAHVETTIERAKIEVSAHAMNVITRLGLERVAAMRELPISTDDEGKKD